MWAGEGGGVSLFGARERGIVRDGLLRILRKVSAGEYRDRNGGMKELDVSRCRVQYIMIIVGFITRYRGLLSR